MRDAHSAELAVLSGKSKAKLPAKVSTAFDGAVNIALKQKKRRKG